MCALSVVGANLITSQMTPLTQTTGGTSKSDPGAGSGSGPGPGQEAKTVTTGDKAGAGILTVLVIGLIIGTGCWLVL